MTISPVYAYPAAQTMYSTPIPYAAAQQNQPVMNISSNAKGEPDLVCDAKYDAKTKTLRLSSFERGWMDSNLWYELKADGSGEMISAWGKGAKYPAGTFLDTLNKAQGIYYTQGEISNDAALDLVKDTRAAIDVARQNGTENFIQNGTEAILNGTMSIS